MLKCLWTGLYNDVSIYQGKSTVIVNHEAIRSDAYAGFLMLELDDCNFDKNWEYRYLDLRVETTGKYTLGAACYDQRDWNQDQPSWGDVPNNVHVITRGNSARFNKILLSRTFGAAFEEK